MCVLSGRVGRCGVSGGVVVVALWGGCIGLTCGTVARILLGGARWCHD